MKTHAVLEMSTSANLYSCTGHAYSNEKQTTSLHLYVLLYF